jgi:hypothetical protein
MPRGGHCRRRFELPVEGGGRGNLDVPAMTEDRVITPGVGKYGDM